MPPLTRTLSDSRRRLLDEEEVLPAHYFPSTPVGGGKTAFDGYTTPAAAAHTRLTLDEIMTRRNDQQTKLAENKLTRANAGEKMKLLPYMTAAEKARLQLMPQSYESAGRVLPFQEQAQIQQAQTNAAEDESKRRQLRGVEELSGAERGARMEAIRNADPHETELTRITKNNPAAISAYASFLRSAPPRLKGDKARRHAYDFALAFVRDQTAVEAIDMMDATEKSTRLRDELLDDIEDPLTGEYIGSRVRKGADPKKITEAVKMMRNAKRLDAGAKVERDLERQERTDNVKLQTEAIRGLNSIADDMVRQYAVKPTPELKAEIEQITARRLNLMKNLETGGTSAAVQSAPPVTSVLEKWKATFKK